MSPTEIVIAVVIAVGVVGIVVPVLPGSLLVLGAILAWAAEIGTGRAWIVFAVATSFLVFGTIVKYAVPGRRLKASGVPNTTLLLGALGGVVGFFVIPVVGVIAGFVGGIYLAERRRLGRAAAWPATKAALRAVGLSILIEMTAAVLAAATWFVGVILT